MTAYSFLDVQGAISGPGGAFSIGSDAGNSDEGVEASYTNEKDTMTTGAGGAAMHSLRASNAGKITISLLKTSRVNAQLSQLYNYQTQSSANWGQNTVTFGDVARGDLITAKEVAFVKHADMAYKVEGGMMVWEFNVGHLTIKVGTGTPSIT